MGWRISANPGLALGDHPGADVAQVVAEIGGRAWSDDPVGLPDDARRALESDGRAELLKILYQDEPPLVVRLFVMDRGGDLHAS